jgi:hypothetical protein
VVKQGLLLTLPLRPRCVASENYQSSLLAEDLV